MQCELGRELISAGLDDELGDTERAALDHHLEGCADCSAYSVAATRLHRSSRVVPAAPVPDLTDAILGRLADEQHQDPQPPRSIRPAPLTGRRSRRTGRSRRTDAERRARTVFVLQYGLLVVALSMVVLSVPELLATTGAAVHTTRHLGVWDLAFAVGLLVAALQPWRARGLLPMAVALGCAMALTAGLDLSRGVTTGIAELSHLLEVLGLVFLWLLARVAPSGTRLGPSERSPVRAPAAASPGLRVLHQMRAWAGAHPGSAAPAPHPVARDDSDAAERAA